MSKKPDNDALIAAGIGALFGLGMAAIMASSSENRQGFTDRVAADLAQSGYTLVKCELGRSQSNAPVWNVTLQHPYRGVMSLVAEFPIGTQPYAIATAQALTQRIVSHLQNGSA